MNRLNKTGSAIFVSSMCSLLPELILPHNLMKEKLKDLIECSFQREGSPYLACHDKNAFFTSEHQNRYKLWSCQNMYEI